MRNEHSGVCGRTDESANRLDGLLRDMVEMMDMLILAVTPDGGIVYANPAAVRSLGYPPEEILNLRVSDIDPAYPEDKARAKIADLLREGGGLIRTSLRRKDGTTFPVLNTFSATQSEGDAEKVLLCFIRDLSEQLQVESTLLETERFLDGLVEQVSDMVTVKSARDLKYVRINRVGEALLGLTRDELIGRSAADLWRDDAARQSEADDRAVLSGEASEMVGEETVRIRDGGRKLLRTRRVPILDGNGTPEYLLSIAKDITESRGVERALRFTRFAMDRASDMVLWMNEEGRIVYANEGVTRTLGYGVDELLNLSISDIDPNCPPEAWPVRWDGIQRKTIRVFESVARTKDRREIPVEVAADYVEFEGQAFACCIGRDITERKRFERDLLEREERLRILFDYAPDAYYILDLEGRLIDANRAAEQMAGRRREDYLGRNFLEWGVLPDDEHAAALKLLRRNADAEPTGPDNLTLVRPDGVLRRIDVRTYPVRIQGRTKVLGIARDVTERVAAEESLKRQLRFQAFLSAAAAELATASTEEFNPAVTRILGALGMMLEVDWVGLSRREEVGAPRQIYTWTRSGEETGDAGWPAELPQLSAHLARDGEFWFDEPGQIPAEWEAEHRFARSLRARSGGVVAPIGQGDSCISLGLYRTEESLEWPQETRDQVQLVAEVLANAVARRITEDALRVSEYRYRQLFATVPDAVLVLDETTGQILDVNSSAERLYGYEREHFLGLTVEDLAGPEDDSEAARPAGTSAVPTRDHRRTDGSRFPVEVTEGSIDLGGRRIVCALVRDITNRRQAAEKVLRLNEQLEERVRVRTGELDVARQEAENANRAKSVFLANMSHEIRTPMNAVLGFAQLMGRENRLTETQRRYLDTIINSGDHLLSLIEDILEVAKIESGRVEFRPQIFDLQALMDGIGGIFQIRVASFGLQLLVTRGTECPRHVFGDEHKIRQVVTNLVGNAVKFTEEGRVVLRCGMEVRDEGAQWLIVEVADTGVGIAREDQEKIFEQFHQVGTAESTQKGTGLGLAISREYARLMGGDLTVRSQPGEGSIFRLEVPIEERAGAEPAPPEVERRVAGIKPGQRHLRILVVDDDRDNRELSRELLESVGFETLVARNGVECLKIAAEWPPDVVLMDIVMPELGGFETAAKLNEDPALSGTKVIIQSASQVSERDEWNRHEGVDAFIRKPVRDDTLFEILARLTGIEFIYQDASAPAPQLEDHESVHRALWGLPVPLQQDLLHACLRCDIGRLKGAIARVAEHDADTAEILRSLASRYAFDVLVEILEQTGDRV